MITKEKLIKNGYRESDLDNDFIKEISDPDGLRYIITCNDILSESELQFTTRFFMSGNSDYINIKYITDNIKSAEELFDEIWQRMGFWYLEGEE